MAIIHTGSTSIDRLLGGGIHTGTVSDIYGQSGAGKSQLCFTLCANYAKHSRQEDRILFIDTVGTFRPERISEIAGRKSSTVLNKIMFVRALSVYDQINAIGLISNINPRLVIVDTATALISDEFRGPARHLILMNYVHKLSLAAINFDCAIVITNVIRDTPIRTTLIDQGGHNLRAAIKTTVNSSQQREFMGASLSIYIHIKLKLEIINLEKSLFGASLMQPIQKDRVLFNITSKGISDG